MKNNFLKLVMFFTLFVLTSTLFITDGRSNFEELSSEIDVNIYANEDDQPMGVVIVDDLHDNDYTDGSMNLIKNELESLGYIVFYSSEYNSFIDAVQVANYLVISAPMKVFSVAERTAIFNWFEDGSRNIILASRGDFSEPKYDSMNTLLSELGSTVKTQDDNIYTTDTDVPNPWYVDSDNFNEDDYPSIFSGLNTIGFFSPSSINPGTNGDVMVYAEKEAYQSNEKGDEPEIIFDDTDDGEGGDTIPLIVYEEVNNGDLKDRIITVGTTLWADFDYGATGFGDIDFFHNSLAYLREKTIEEAGEIDLNAEDKIAPTVEINYPHDQAFLKGEINIEIEAFDAFGIDEYKLFINNIKVSDTSNFVWDTTKYSDGIYTVKAEVTDIGGNVASVSNKYNVLQSFEPFLEEDPKIMTYNIKESGVFEEWFDVMLEENADIIVLVETGDFDDENNALLDKTINDLNDYFFDEVEYQGYTMQDITNAWNGITILSRYDITSNTKLSNLKADDGSSVFIPLPFLHSVVDIGGWEVNFIGTHLSCCSGQSNWNERYEQQESMLNYMDDLGDVPIIYLGDFNAESPDDVDPNSQDPDNDLGTEPIEMVLNPDHVSASKIHRFVDVAEEMGTKDITYIACCNSRIDYIFVNQHFDDLILDSTTGDTKNGLLGSDHTSVDVNLDLSNYIEEPIFNLTEITDVSESNSITSTMDEESSTSEQMLNTTEATTVSENAGIKEFTAFIMTNLIILVNLRKRVEK